MIKIIRNFVTSEIVSICIVSVGTNVGDIGLWEVGSRERLVQKTFKVWDLSKCSMPLQVPFFLKIDHNLKIQYLF